MSAQTEQNNSGTTMDAYRRWVEDLAVKQRAQHALRCLMRVGAQTTPALLEGLGHPDHEVRIGCCKVLDHYLDPAALPELIRNLNHEDERVRAWATSRWRVRRFSAGAKSATVRSNWVRSREGRSGPRRPGKGILPRRAAEVKAAAFLGHFEPEARWPFHIPASCRESGYQAAPISARVR